jgi:predicted ATPase
LHYLREFNPRLTDIFSDPAEQGARIYAYEEGLDHAISAGRLSDGTLRYLWLLAILLDPISSGIICIEEPELGLHPDILPTVAELLLLASERAQIIVTTHSDHLVSAFSKQPDAVLICDQTESGTSLKRLNPSELAKWLGRYALGDLWLKGEIGGTRW